MSDSNSPADPFEASSTSGDPPVDPGDGTNMKWYQGISRYQWLVLLIASLGWVFDVFEGQIFVASMRDAMPSLMGIGADDPAVTRSNNLAFGFFLLGGAIGGVVFGVISDRIGRSKTMIFTILFYSLFTCLSAFALNAWHLILLRFLVAMGVGGEWAVASAMVAEVMPTRSRPVMSSIFHASSVFGTLLAVTTIALLIGNPEVNAWFASKGWEGWRIGFAIGVLPALLTVWIRWKLHEPASWQRAKQREAQDSSQATGRIGDLFSADNLRSTLIGVTLSTIGLVTFWGIHIYGKNAMMRSAQTAADQAVEAELGPPPENPTAQELSAYESAKQQADQKYAPQIKRAEMASMAINTIGGGLGLVLFGWISTLLGRKGAFVMYHLVAFVCVLILFQYLIPKQASTVVLAVFLPIFGFFTLGMHAGYAVYFPELYPTRLRGTGAGFCFNMGRLGTALAFFVFGFWIKITPESQALWLSPLYLLGAVVVLFARETRGTELPE